MQHIICQRWIKGLFFSIFLIFYFLFFLQHINLTTADLGRHIKNGEVFFQQLRPIETNFYSYTMPEFPTINHHWGAGVIFYLFWKWFGFIGLSLIHALLYTLTFLVFFFIAKKKTSFYMALFVSLLVVPLIASRTEVRPEVFSYLFLGLYYLLLNRFIESKGKSKIIWLLPFLQLLWVNIHIFFFLGLVMVGIFFVDVLINKKDKKIIHKLGFLLIAVTITSLINPFGLSGALVPLTIFKEYGYRLAENQSVLFMQRFFGSLIYLHFELLFGIVILFAFSILFEKKLFHYFIGIILLTFFSVVAWKTVRSLPLFGFIFIPVASEFFYEYLNRLSLRTQEHITMCMSGAIVLILFLAVFLPHQYFSPFKTAIGLGLMPGVNNSAVFFKENRLQGPIFNNYDIGGYLIYHLYPQEKVFVDNRPEAYSVSFFKDEYIPMQENNDIWKRMDQHYNFNTIYFYRHDLTPWGQNFLIQRIQDPAWAAVYVDDFTIIFLKRNNQNNTIIQQKELPKELFNVI
jgi:hypothetical protein